MDAVAQNGGKTSEAEPLMCQDPHSQYLLATWYLSVGDGGVPSWAGLFREDVISNTTWLPSVLQ